MFSMNTDRYESLFAALKVYLTANSVFSPSVLKKPMTAEPRYPQVVFSEISNTNDSMTTDRRQVIDLLGFEVDVFSTILVVDGETIDNLVICRELTALADHVMFRYGFRRISKTPTPTVDTTLFRIVSRYTGRVFNNYNQIL